MHNRSRPWLIDGHLDLAFNAVMLGRDLLGTVAAIRQAEGARPAHGEGIATVSLPALRTADVRVALATLFAAPAASAAAYRGYRTTEEAHAQALEELDYYHRLQERGEATLICRRGELDAVAAGRAPGPGLVVLMEGADALRTPADLAAFVARGVRIVGLTWRATRYAGSTGQPGPLTPAGHALLQEMARLGVALDISHLAEEACWQALAAFDGPVVASHANCRALVPGARQLSDAQIRAVADRDGVIGLVCYNYFIRAGWTAAMGKAAVALADLAAHARHIAAVAGMRAVALGSDLDGGIGYDHVPREIDTVADLPQFADALADAGFTRADITAILHENWLRALRKVLTD